MESNETNNGVERQMCPNLPGTPDVLSTGLIFLLKYNTRWVEEKGVTVESGVSRNPVTSPVTLDRVGYKEEVLLVENW